MSKGSKWRPGNRRKYRENLERIFGKKGVPEPAEEIRPRRRLKASPEGAAAERVERALRSGKINESNMYERGGEE